MPWTTSRFPGLEGPLHEMIEQHRELNDEPLLLAMIYDPGRESPDIFLFELLEHFGQDLIEPDRTLFEATYGTGLGLPLEPSQKLHLVLTHPEELRVALEQDWDTASEVRSAVGRGDYEILFMDEKGERALELLHD